MTAPTVSLVGSWIKRAHPAYAKVCEVHERRWAIYRSRREELFPKYLEAHRLEAHDESGKAGVSVFREKLGYAPGLAQGIIKDIIGHIGATKRQHNWGDLADGQAGKDNLPTGRAKTLYDDATRDGRDWESFFGNDVLEQILVTKGGVIVIDAPPKGAQAVNVEQAKRAGIRPYVSLVDFNQVVDWKWGKRGFEFVKLKESNDTRSARDGDSRGFATEQYVLYEFAGDLATAAGVLVSRFDTDGKPVGTPILLDPVYDTEGIATLPVIPAVFAPERDRTLKPLGRGMLDGVDDIEIDLANQINELRDEGRSIVFGLLAYTGTQGENVEEQLNKNSRLLDCGPEGSLNYVSADGEVVTQLLTVIDRTYAAWRSAVRQKPAELIDSAAARSGQSFQSEFAVNWKPLLGGISQALDDIETQVLYIVGQFWGLTTEAAAELSVKRDKNFRLEDEGSFLARAIKDITSATADVPALPMARLIVAMMQAFGAIAEEDDIDELTLEVQQAITDKRAADVFMNALRGGPGAGDGTSDTPPGDTPPPPAKPAKPAKPKPGKQPPSTG